MDLLGQLRWPPVRRTVVRGGPTTVWPQLNTQPPGE
jgi:hypothetical protein